MSEIYQFLIEDLDEMKKIFPINYFQMINQALQLLKNFWNIKGAALQVCRKQKKIMLQNIKQDLIENLEKEDDDEIFEDFFGNHTRQLKQRIGELI